MPNRESTSNINIFMLYMQNQCASPSMEFIPHSGVYGWNFHNILRTFSTCSSTVNFLVIFLLICVRNMTSVYSLALTASLLLLNMISIQQQNFVQKSTWDCACLRVPLDLGAAHVASHWSPSAGPQNPPFPGCWAATVPGRCQLHPMAGGSQHRARSCPSWPLDPWRPQTRWRPFLPHCCHMVSVPLPDLLFLWTHQLSPRTHCLKRMFLLRSVNTLPQQSLW